MKTMYLVLGKYEDEDLLSVIHETDKIKEAEAFFEQEIADSEHDSTYIVKVLKSAEPSIEFWSDPELDAIRGEQAKGTGLGVQGKCPEDCGDCTTKGAGC